MRLRGVLLGVVLAGIAASLYTIFATVPRSSRPATVPNCGVQQTRPANLTIACGDGNDYLESLHWSVWSGSVARGTGIEKVNDCDPYCAAGKFHNYAAAITLDRVESHHFTRLRLHYSGARPPNTPQDVSRTLR